MSTHEKQHTGISIQEKIVEGEKLGSPTAFCKSLSFRRERGGFETEVELFRDLDTIQRELHEALDCILVLNGLNDPVARGEVFQLLDIKKQSTSFTSGQRINKIVRLIEICNKQSEHINNIEKPLELVQSYVRSWIVREKLPLLGKINISIWNRFLKSEKKYVAQLASIVANYRIPIQRQIDIGNFPIALGTVFEYTDNILAVSQELFRRLENQNSYYPIIFGIGSIFQYFVRELLDHYEVYIYELQKKLDLYEDLTEVNTDLYTFLVSQQFTSDFSDISLDELFRLPSEHVLKYEETLGEIVRSFIREVHLVIPSECTYKDLSAKTPPKTWSFMMDFVQRKHSKNDHASRNQRSSLALGNMMKGVIGGTPSKGQPSRKRDSYVEEGAESQETETSGGRRTKFPIIRSGTSGREDSRKRSSSSNNSKLPVGNSTEKKPLPTDTIEKKPKAQRSSMINVPPTLSSDMSLESLLEPRKENASPSEVARGQRSGQYRREKSAAPYVTKKKRKDSISETEPPTPQKEPAPIVKANPETLPSCILDEIQTLWVAYNDMKQQTQKFDKLIGGALFCHLYKKQLKRYDWIRRNNEIICEGDLMLQKKRVSDKDKETQTLNRHFFLFSNFIALAVPIFDMKQNKKETDGRNFFLKHVWNLQRVTMLSYAPEPTEDDDDKIQFDVSVEKTIPAKEGQEATVENIVVTIISEDSFFKVLREQIDLAGTKVFGVDLMKLAKRVETTDGVPNIIIITTQWIKERCTDVEGIFRKSAALTQAEDLKARIDLGNVNYIEDEEDEHVVAHIIKSFFREMPVPLIPYSHYAHYMDIGLKLSEQQIQPSEVITLLTPHLINLPKPHLKLLIFLLQFLSDMSQYAESTKMDTANLAIVFATNVIKPEEETIDITLKFNHVNNLFKIMIEHVNDIIAVLPKDNERDMDNWLQDAIKHTKTTPIYVEDAASLINSMEDPALPKTPAASVEPTSPTKTPSDTEKRKSGKSSGSIWSANRVKEVSPSKPPEKKT
jgi:hypothetical protein